MAAEASRSSPSADSYIGSLISLTSKSEIRYEGILYSINSEESTIGLRNVRSFGTEARKKDGQQLPAGDKIYEFILFRGSDIKDLQVKASPPAQTIPMQHDPAIIQLNYLHPSTASLSLPANLPSFESISVPELSSNTAQFGLQQPSFQGSLPTHQNSGSFGTWSAIPPPQAIPMYWQCYYAHSQVHSHLQQLPLIRPLPALAKPPVQQTLQSQGTNALLSSVPSNYPEFPPLFPPVSSSLNLASTSIPSTVSPIQMTSLTSEMSPFSVSNKIPDTSISAPIPSLMLLPLPPIASNVETSASLLQNIPSFVNSISRIGPFSSVGNQTETRSTPPIVGLSGSKQLESSDTLVTPDQLKQLTSSVSPSSQSLAKLPNEMEVQPPADRTKGLLSERPAPK